MQNLCDFSNLYQTNSTFSTSKTSIFHFDLQKLKAWWRLLSKEEKALICIIDLPEIIADFADATIDAVLLCKVNRKYNKKSLITSKKLLDPLNNIHYHQYKFNFVGKEILPENIAQLFSSFSLKVERVSKTDKNPEEKKKTNFVSLLKVKDEFLDSIIELLESVVAGFGKGEKILFQKEELGKIYITTSDYSFNKFPAFRLIESSSVQKLLHKLVSISILIENNLYQFFKTQAKTPFEKELLITRTKNTEFETTKSTSSESSTQGTFTALTQTPVDSNSLPSEDAKDNKDTFNGENFSQANLYGYSPYYSSVQFQGRELLNMGNTEHALEKEEQESDFETMNDYQGFQMGNLQIDFESMDIFLTKFLDQESGSELLKKEIKQHQIEAAEIALEIQVYNSMYGEKGGSHYGSRSVNEILDPSNEYIGSDMTHMRGYGSYGSRKKSNLYGFGYHDGRKSSRDSFLSYEDSGDIMLNGGYYTHDYRHKKHYGRGYQRGKTQIYYLPKEKNKEGEQKNAILSNEKEGGNEPKYCN